MIDDLLSELEERITQCLETMKELSPESEEYRRTSDALVKLYELRNKCIENYQEQNELVIKNTLESDEISLKRRDEIRDDIKFVVKLVAELFVAIGPCIMYYDLVDRGYKIEENGVICSSTLKSLLSKFKFFK